MPARRSAEIRWIVVYKRLVLDHDWKMVDKALNGASKHFQNDVIDLFNRTGDVVPPASRKTRSRPRSKMTSEMDLVLLGQVLDDPCATLLEHSSRISLSHGSGSAAHASSSSPPARMGLQPDGVAANEPCGLTPKE